VTWFLGTFGAYGTRFGAFSGRFVARITRHESVFGVHEIPPYLCSFCVAWTWTQHHTCRTPPVPLLQAERGSYAGFRGNGRFGPSFVYGCSRSRPIFGTRAHFRGALPTVHELVVGDV
jgi:hypothetical protein